MNEGYWIALTDKVVCCDGEWRLMLTASSAIALIAQIGRVVGIAQPVNEITENAGTGQLSGGGMLARTEATPVIPPSTPAPATARDRHFVPPSPEPEYVLNNPRATTTPAPSARGMRLVQMDTSSRLNLTPLPAAECEVLDRATLPANRVQPKPQPKEKPHGAQCGNDVRLFRDTTEVYPDETRMSKEVRAVYDLLLAGQPMTAAVIAQRLKWSADSAINILRNHEYDVFVRSIQRGVPAPTTWGIRTIFVPTNPKRRPAALTTCAQRPKPQSRMAAILRVIADKPGTTEEILKRRNISNPCATEMQQTADAIATGRLAGLIAVTDKTFDDWRKREYTITRAGEYLVQSWTTK